MLKINGTITKVTHRDTKIGQIYEYTIADGGLTYKVTDFSCILSDNGEMDTVEVAVRAKATVYNGKAFIQYSC